MRLYHMTTLEVAMTHILPERRMRLSRFHELNDPFELMSFKVEGRMGRKVYKHLLGHWGAKLGIMCMVRHWRSPLMWAHYANNHKGVCLGFDIPDELPKKIRYTSERTTHVLDDTLPTGGITFDQLQQALTTKSTGWSYEEEWRLFSSLDDADLVNGAFYVNFGSTLVLREIIIGARCGSLPASFIDALGMVEQSVTIRKARPSVKTFTMVRQRLVTPIIVQLN